MKRVLSLICLACALALLASCGASTPSTSSAKPSSLSASSEISAAEQSSLLPSQSAANTSATASEASSATASATTSVRASSIVSSALVSSDINSVSSKYKNVSVMSGKRDAWLWPFSKESIWNMPIGSGAKYEPANFQTSVNVAYDPEYFITTTNADPLIKIYAPNGKERWPGNLSNLRGYIRLPQNFVITENSHNCCATILNPDGTTYDQVQPLHRESASADYATGWKYGGPNGSPMSLYGEGIGGTHYGSGLSAIGGSIRSGELTGSGNINHALKLNIYAHEYCYYGTDVPGFVWPADRCDSYAANPSSNLCYGGKNPKLTMGTLLALPQDVTAESLGLKTEVAKKLFYALKYYGAYVSDDSAWNSYAFCMDINVDQEVINKYGYSLKGGKGDYFNDCMKMITRLCIITNNSPSSIGGGGTPLKPLAPDFAK